MDYVAKFVTKNGIVCWSCENVSSEKSIRDLDGFCPFCNIEIDLSEPTYVEESEESNDE